MRRSGGAARPLLAPGRSPEQVLDEIARAREDAYKAAAHVLVDTAGRSPGQAALAVLIATGWSPE
jgi:shikimate kinase